MDGKPPPYSACDPPPVQLNVVPALSQTYGIGPVANQSVMAAPVIVRPLGPQPQVIVCPFCRASISTSIKTEPNTRTHIIALLLCIFVCWPCCLIPYCMDSCQDANHYCPKCQAFLGSYLH